MKTLRASIQSILESISRVATGLTAGNHQRLSELVALLHSLEVIPEMPAAMSTQVRRLAALGEKSLTGEADAEGAIPKLQEGLTKMARAFEGIPVGGALDASSEDAALVSSAPTRRDQVRKHLEQLGLKAPTLDSRNLATLGSLVGHFQAIDKVPGVPEAMITLSKRLFGLLEKAVMGETNVDSAIAKIREGIEKMTRSFEEMPAGGALDESFEAVPEPIKIPSPPPPPPPMIEIISSIPPSAEIDEESMQLRRRFAENQRAQLEDFEVAVLEQEKGNPAGTDFVKRHLHTLKGEFGVLDMPKWSDLIHHVETALEEGRLGVEGLLKLKDLLDARLPDIAGGNEELHSRELSEILGKGDAEAQHAAAPAAETRSQVDSVATAGSEGSEQKSTETMLQDTAFLVDFIAEGGDHIHVIEKSLLRLETAPTDDEALNLVFRSCHTLKGLAGFLDLPEIQGLAHAAESLMDQARNHEITLCPEHVDLLLEVTDCFKELVNGLEIALAGGDFHPTTQVDSLVARLKAPHDLEPMKTISSEKGNSRIGEVLIEHGLATTASVDEALEAQRKGDPRPLGEILLQGNDVSARDVAQVLGAQIEARKPAAVAQDHGNKASVEENIRVPVQRLDLLIDAIGEAVIAQSMAWADPALSEIKDLSLEKKMAQAALMMRQIQELSMSLRMVSIRGTFQKMSRLVRDLSRKLDKQIDLVLEGEDTELDKTVVENIGDPLIHMVRNSLDHGIEMPTERSGKGKSPTGRISLRAYHKAGNVYIEIEDDGKGLDRDAILAKAIASGIARPDQHYTDSEIHQMVFSPGLSTAKAVTDISGRGVGMDVVKKNIEALRGTVEIRSEKGKGSCFVIRLPLTLAIINGMVVRVREERYIVPTLSILATVRPDQSQIQTVVGKGELLNLRGELIRLIRLSEAFGEARRNAYGMLENEFQVVLVVEDTVGRKAGILVDEILDQQQVVIKSLGTALGDVQGVSGGAIMNDGSVSLIVDVGGVVKAASV
jgi:two-component system, chemotaxis family, sensor kinase CheA